GGALPADDLRLRLLGGRGGGGLGLGRGRRDVDDDGVGVGQHLDVGRQVQVAHVDGAALLQLVDVDADRLGHADGQAFDGEGVDGLVQDAAGRDARGDAPDLDRHGDVDALVGRHAGEVDVQHLLAQVVPLDLADEGLLNGPVRVQVDDAGAV